MLNDIKSLLKNEIAPLLGLGEKCDHSGEELEYCGKCGADLRRVVKYECRVCSLSGRVTNYFPEDVPHFCRKCGAPRFTFVRSRTLKSGKKIAGKGGKKKEL